MTHPLQVRRLYWPALAVAALTAFGWSEAATSAQESATPRAEPPARYPYDPVCPWGRLADGHGLLVRCIEQSEALQLTAMSAPRPREATSLFRPPPLASSTPNTSSAVMAPSRARKVVIKDVGPARADTGDLPEARGQLKKPLDRYIQCVESNGGLTGDSGQVTLRFLVRERGRAEGVAVQDRRGVSLVAAKCIADVVDRRYVGYPAAPIVGATLTIDLGAENAAR